MHNSSSAHFERPDILQLSPILPDPAQCLSCSLQRYRLTLVESRNARIGQVQDRTRSLDQVPLFCRTSRQAVLEEFLVFMYEVVQLPVLVREGVQLVDVQFAQLFNVHWSALFVGLVVELGIVFVDVGLFGVVVAIADYQY